MKIIVLAKNKKGLESSLNILRNYSTEIDVYTGEANDPFPVEVNEKEIDLLISYISPWIVPESVLKKVKKYSINFHPGPPEYPGIGCTNFALYNNEKEFGITAHIMKSKVDTGKIVHVERFPVYPNDSVFTLTERCYLYIQIAFIKVMDKVFNNEDIIMSDEEWKRKPYRRKELNELCKIDISMNEEEIQRRVKATVFPGKPGAFIELAGFKFVYSPESLEIIGGQYR